MAFIFSGIIYSFLEVFLLNLLLKNALKGNMQNSLILLFLKLASYTVAFSLIYFFFLDAVKLLAIGYTIGVFTSLPVILLFSKKNFKNDKGDDNK